MLKLIDARTAKPQYLRRLKRLYKQAFPWYERKPWPLLIRTAAQGQAELLAVVREDHTFCGLAVCLLWQDLAFLDYLAVEPALRSHGVGAQIIPLLLQRYPKRRLLLESERPGAPFTNLADCRRRLAFYQKCGLQDTGVIVRLYISEYLLLWTAGAQADRQAPGFADYVGVYNGLFGELAAGRLKIRDLSSEFAVGQNYYSQA